MEALKCKNLSFTYPNSQAPALRDISFSINAGELCVVMGKSASGKTTLLKLMKKEIAPAGAVSGKIEAFGKVGYVAQNVEESIVCNKVRAELSFAPANEGKSEEEIELAVAETASYFNLESKLEYDVSSLSGGEKQILNLASVMIMKPDILVLDEPASQLDPVWAERFADIIRKLHRDFSTTIIIAEHNANALFESADSILLLGNSKLLIKDKADAFVDYLRKNNNDMLGAVPVSMSLYNGAKTIGECSELFREKQIKRLKKEAMPKETAVEIKSIYFAYEKGKDTLSGLNLKVYKGKINAVLGPNSSGKTTLLKAIAGVCKPYRGRIKADGRISMLSQNVFDLFTKETCGEEADFEKFGNLLEINDIKERHPYDISGGQAQRLALAKVLERNADIILLDEPTKGFDCVLKEKLASLLKELCKQGKTVLIVTHDIEFISRYCDVASFLSRGRVVSTKPRREFFSSLSFYTSSIGAITKTDLVSIDDLTESGGI